MVDLDNLEKDPEVIKWREDKIGKNPDLVTVRRFRRHKNGKKMLDQTGVKDEEVLIQFSWDYENTVL